jgi:hypothetical protein
MYTIMQQFAPPLFVGVDRFASDIQLEIADLIITSGFDPI